MLDRWMKLELETIYGEPVVVLYDGDRYPIPEKEDELRKVIDLADCYRNSYCNDSGVIVMDKKTADFWFSIIDEAKQSIKEKYSI
jgi:hypothetical protein